MPQQYQFRKGADVFDSDGNKIGDVSDVGSNYLDVTTGFLGLGGNLFIPFDAVSRVEGDRIYLNVSRDRIGSMGWNEKPAEAMTTGQAQTYGTMPAAGATGYGLANLPQHLTGYELYSSDDKDVGKVYDESPGYIHVRTGLFGLGGEFFVPRDAIDRCTDDRCYLKVPADRIKDMGWNRRPTEAVGYAEREAAPPTREAAPRPREEVTEARPAPTEEGVHRMSLRDEEIEVHKHREKVGEVVISKDVVEEQRSINVPVSHEEVRIERHDVDRPTTGEITEAGTKEEIRVPIYEDVVDVEKRPHVHEEVTVSPEEVTSQERVTRTVRREVPEVKMTGEAEKYVEGEEAIEEESRRAHGEVRHEQQRRAP